MKKIILMGYPKGGIGKSIFTWNIAIALILKGFKVRIVDIDFQQTTVFANALRVNNNVEALEVVSIKTVEKLNDFLEEDFEGFTLIDIGGFDTPLNRLALQKTDYIFLPFSADPTEIIGLRTFGKILTQANINTNKIKVFLNHINPRTTKLDLIKKKISNTYPNFFETVIRTSKDIKMSIGDGLGVVELKQRKNNKTKKLEDIPAKIQMNNLVNEILQMGA